MNIRTYTCVAAITIFSAFSPLGHSHGLKKGKQMEITGTEAKAIASAYRIAESMHMDISKYKVHISEDAQTYTISFIDVEKPSSVRGSRDGFPQPSLKIDKNSGELIEQSFSR